MGVFGPGTLITGSNGSSGTATFTGALQHYTDYRLDFTVTGATDLAPVAVSDSPLIPGQTAIKAAHILDLRAALGRAYDAANRTPPTYGEAIGPGASIRVSQVGELRDAVSGLE